MNLFKALWWKFCSRGLWWGSRTYAVRPIKEHSSYWNRRRSIWWRKYRSCRIRALDMTRAGSTSRGRINFNWHPIRPLKPCSWRLRGWAINWFKLCWELLIVGQCLTRESGDRNRFSWSRRILRDFMTVSLRYFRRRVNGKRFHRSIACIWWS